MKRLPCAVLAFLACCAVRPARAGDERPTPRLAVLLVVDQMRADYLDRFAPMFDAGLLRLTRGGEWFLLARHRHAITSTAPGHATLSTGCDPAHHGVVANVLFDRASKTFIRAGIDSKEKALRVAEGTTRSGVSPRCLKVTALGDWIKAHDAKARVASVASKARSAVMLGGQHPDLALYAEGQNGAWTTSSWYAKANPPFVDAFNAAHPIESLLGSSWTTALSDDRAAALGATPDDMPYEGREPFGTEGNAAFPHRLDSIEATYFTPFADDRTLDAARAVLDGLDMGTDDACDLLAVSLSASDMIGHAYGPDSREIVEYYHWLDGALGRFLDDLDRRVGAGRWLFVLAADHGVASIAEHQIRWGLDGGRVGQPQLRNVVDAALDERFGADDWVIEATPEIFLDPDALTRHGVARKDAQEVTVRALRSLAGVQDAYPRWRFEARDPTIPAPFLASFDPERSGDAMPNLRANYYPDYLDTTAYVKANHSTQYDYDQRIPAVFYGAGLPARMRTDRFESVDIAPTIARFLGVEPQKDVDGRAIGLDAATESPR